MTRGWRERQYLVSRHLGRAVTRACAAATFFRMPPFVSTSAVVTRDDQVLTVLDPIRREAVLPGGHLRWKEAPEAGLVREVREETGHAIRVDRLLGVFAGTEWAGEEGIIRVVYAASITGGELRSSGEGQPGWEPLAAFAASETRDGRLLRAVLGEQQVTELRIP